MRVNSRSGFAPIMVAAGLVMAPTGAAIAGGAFAVDDAEVGAPGECKVESWGSFASNHDFIAVTSPSCVAKLGVPIEFAGQFQRARSDSVWSTSGTLRAKTNLIPLANHAFGVGLSGGGTWDLISGANTGSFINVPVTFQLREEIKLNINGGWQYDATSKIHYLTWGTGFEWNFVKPLTLIGEIYGQSGRLPEGDPDSAPTPNSIREPRAQVGLRYTPQEKFDIDLIWGRNVTGENAHWVTLGLNVRF